MRAPFVCLAAGVAAAMLAAATVRTSATGTDTGQSRAFKYLMGTSMRVEAYGGTPAVRQAAVDEAFAAMAGVDAVMSPVRGDSELSMVNRTAASHAVAVSAPLFAVIAAASRVSALSGGAFTLTKPPATVASVVLEPERRTVRFTDPGVWIDPAGAAKGFAAELASGSLRRRGVAGLVDAGGVQFFVGTPPGKAFWSIGISDPRRPGALLGAIDVGAGAVSTTASPDARERSGVALSATVVSADATLAGALSRAAFALGPRDGLALLSSVQGTWGVIAVRQPDGRVDVAVAPGHERAFHPASAR
jgi:thiamine biosynthesis lipoprotein